MNKVNIQKVVIAGVAGTLAMTVLRMLGALAGFPKMDMGMMLGTNNPMMPMPYMLGWVMHFVIGTILTYIYAAFVVGRLPSEGWMQGTIYSLAPWLVMSLLLAPMMGMPLFGGPLTAAVAGLLGHLAYGSVMGYLYGDGNGEAVAATAD